MRGSTVLVVLTQVDEQDNIIGEERFAGVISETDAHRGIGVKRSDNTISWLPPTPEAFHLAEPGNYLVAAGAVISDPDCSAASTTRVPRASPAIRRLR